jgi:SAM-dependent methyltransferase
MYTKTARIYDDLYSFKDYPAMARHLIEIIDTYHPGAESVLEVACGTGQFLRYLRQRFHVEGLDINPDMLEVAAEYCPEIPLHHFDMVDFSIAHRFDVIACLFSSIAYVKTVERMQCAIVQMTRHLNTGGLLLVEPYFTPETCWKDDLRLNVSDRPDLKIAWMYLTEVHGKLAVADIHYLVGRSTGVEHLTERHELGLFTDTEYRDAMERVGLNVSYDATGVSGRGLYIGISPLRAQGAGNTNG